ncbi:DUF935 domain-containing protein [Stenoxybacter acetivorans]|uniref:DUF935 domain-containing protein n=1 Tax=Stenoxybacter acetivorans TaxID=422441 RepID=UPI0005622D70|nr:DUF935 family protein [Stenoxybacter acetivorans]
MSSRKPHIKLSTTQGKTTVKPQNLSAHIAVARQFMGAGGMGMLLPNPDPILKKLGKDIAVYRDLLSDPIVAGHVRRRKAAVTSLEWRLEADGVPAHFQAALNDYFADLDLYPLINQILDAVLFGYQPLELVWQTDSNLWLPEIVAKPPEWFRFNETAELVFVGEMGGGNSESVPPFKFLCPAHNASYINPYGMGDLASIYWPAVFKRAGLQFWSEFAEKFGAPWVFGKEPRSNTLADTEKLLDSLEKLVGNGVATIPNDSSVDIKEAAGKTGSAEVYDRFIRYCRSEIAIALLGQDQTTEKDTNHASATAGLEVTQDIRDNDCRVVESCLNTLLAWITQLNLGEAATPPRFVLYEEEAGDEALARRDQILTGCGVSFSVDYFKRAYHLSDADIAVPAVDKPAEFTEAAANQPQDLSDRLAVLMPPADELNGYTDKLWQTLSGSLKTFAELGEHSEEQLLEHLAAACPQMNLDELQESLNNMLFTASVLGRLECEQENGL